jgi:glucoamylase
MLIDQYTLGINSSAFIRTLIDDFVSAEATVQQVSNPSGTVSTGGLGEPKFHVNESAFTEPWGRPQRGECALRRHFERWDGVDFTPDGPALRATAIITYANWLIANGNTSHVTTFLWPMLQLDLNYVSEEWNQTTFDLWQELDSSSFWTSLVQHRALRQGAVLAETLGDSTLASAWTAQAQNVLCFVQVLRVHHTPFINVI